MKLSLFFILIGYMLSQFYRAFLAVLTGVLQADIGVTADDLALASGLIFLAFGLAQLPVGWALDKFGPRRTTALLLGLGGTGGALLFASAHAVLHIHAAMVLLGIGGAPVLMASYFIFARSFPPAIFATLAGAMIGVGSLGNILAALPVAWAAEAIGWRACMVIVAGLSAAVAVAIWGFVQDPPAATAEGQSKGSIRDLLRIPALWLMLPLLAVNYAPSAGLRGLWMGPFYTDLYGARMTDVGQVTLLMALAMIAGNFAYGPLDRLFGTRKRVVLAGNLSGVACLGVLALVPMAGLWQTAFLIAAAGFFGASFPMMMAHGRAFIPPHLLGRGVTFLNLFAIGGVGVMQIVSGRVHARAAQVSVEFAYQAVFGFFAVSLLLGCAIYAFARDRTD
ncbi:MAG: MFS transporter [Roseinatronobacter sp.]